MKYQMLLNEHSDDTKNEHAAFITYIDYAEAKFVLSISTPIIIIIYYCHFFSKIERGFGKSHLNDELFRPRINLHLS